MAEYVRRRRPPADHPYWHRLHDRAHPPPFWMPILIPAIIGLASGAYGGLNEAITIADATKFAAIIAVGIGGVAFAIMSVVMFVDATRQFERRQRWPIAIIGGTVICFAVFVATFVPLAAIFVVYSLGTGEGPWIGMLIGEMCWTTPFAVWVWRQRARWRDRQLHWPRWERMRAPNRRASQSSDVVVQQPQLAGTSDETPSVTEPEIEKPSPPVGEPASGS